VDRVGQQLGNYQLTRLLGRGGFAEVYLGEHLRLQTLAAIKVLYTHLEDNDVEEFLKEARTVAHIVHPHIVRIFDFDVHSGTPFLVMDYAPNGTLRQRHPKGTVLPLSAIVDYVKQVADALQYAHDEKLVHRDIKPENMLLGRRNKLLLSDFGIALVAQSSRLQSTQEVVGTAYYMAPEQLQGKPRIASDQYSLGIVVYEWLCGSRPFHGSFSEIASQHMFVHPPPLSEKVPQISPSVEHVVMTALTKDPHKRFGSVKAFANALEQASQAERITPSASSNTLANQTPMQLHPGSVTPSILPPVQVNPTASPSLPTASITPPSQLGTQPVTVTPPNLSYQIATPITPTGPSRLSMRSNLDRLLIQEKLLKPKRKLSRRTFVIGGLVGIAGLAVVGGGITWLERSQIPPLGTILYTYLGHSNIVTGVVWSPDGKRIASGSTDHTVQVWEVTSGKTNFTYNGHASGVNAVAWSPDGKWIAREVMIIQCRYGMLTRGVMSSPIMAILKLYSQWLGHLIISVLPLRALMDTYKYGMLPLGARSLHITVILVM
jgi:serine/threonine protein kinase